MPLKPFLDWPPRLDLVERDVSYNEARKILTREPADELPEWEAVLRELRIIRDCYEHDLSKRVLAGLMLDGGPADKQIRAAVGRLDGWFAGREPSYQDIYRIWAAFLSRRYVQSDEEYCAADIALPVREHTDIKPDNIEAVSRRLLEDTPDAAHVIQQADGRAIAIVWWDSASATDPLATSKATAKPHVILPGMSATHAGTRVKSFAEVMAELPANVARAEAVLKGWSLVIDRGRNIVGVLPPWGYAESLAYCRKGWLPQGTMDRCPKTCGDAARAANAGTAVVVGRPMVQIKVCLCCGRIQPMEPFVGASGKAAKTYEHDAALSQLTARGRVTNFMAPPEGLGYELVLTLSATAPGSATPIRKVVRIRGISASGMTRDAAIQLEAELGDITSTTARAWIAAKKATKVADVEISIQPIAAR